MLFDFDIFNLEEVIEDILNEIKYENYYKQKKGLPFYEWRATAITKADLRFTDTQLEYLSDKVNNKINKHPMFNINLSGSSRCTNSGSLNKDFFDEYYDNVD
jgi:hypothetical protein